MRTPRIQLVLILVLIIFLGITSFQVKGKEEIKFRGTVVDQEHAIGGGWWEVKVENVLVGPDITGDIAKVHYGVFPECIFYRDEDIKVGNKVEVFGELPTIIPMIFPPPPPEVSLCNSGYIIKFPPKPIDWEESGIFPNPVTSNTATLYIEGVFDTVTLMIFDLGGMKVVEETYGFIFPTMDLSQLANGLYLYVLIAKKDGKTSKSPVKKLLVQR